MAGKTAVFTLQTEIGTAEFYVDHSDDECEDSFGNSLVGKDIPTFFTQSKPATGSLSPADTCTKGGQIHIHIYQDADFKSKVVSIKFTEPNAAGVWEYEFLDLDNAYTVNVEQPKDLYFTFTVTLT